MPEYQQRRQAARTLISSRLEARAHATLPVRLLDLITAGARIEHLNLLRPGSPCRPELPPALGAPTVSAQVVWSRLLGREPGPGGVWRIRYQSSLTFVRVTAEQHAALTRLLSIPSTRRAGRRRSWRTAHPTGAGQPPGNGLIRRDAGSLSSGGTWRQLPRPQIYKKREG